VSRVLVATVLGALLLGSAAAAAPYALVVGVSEYVDPTIADLEYAATDARDVALTLETQCGLERADILLLIDGEATRAGIASGFAWLEERSGPGDLIFIYLAGHGMGVVDLDGDEADGDGVDECVLPSDAVLLDPASYLLDDDLGKMIAGLRAGAVSLFLDSCYSGGQGRVAGGPGGVAASGDSIARDVMTAGLGGPVRAVLAACSPHELAYEDPTLESGVFTHFLLAGLQDDSLAGGDGMLTLSELSQYVGAGVGEWSEQSGDAQTPVLDLPPGMDIALIPDIAAVRQDGPPLVAYFPFDDSVEEVVSGYETFSRKTVLVPGIVGNAARFDNKPDDLSYVRTSEAYEPLEGPFAVSLWFRSDRVAANNGALFATHARYNNYGPEYSVWINPDGSLTFRTDDTYGLNHRQDLSTTTYRWDDGAWHHLVVQRLHDGRKEVWVDGRLEASEAYSIQDIRTAANPFTVGGSAYAGWSYVRSFTGEIDELRVYSGSLEPRRIGDLLSAGLPNAPALALDPLLADAVRQSLGLPQETELTAHDLLHVRTLDVKANRPLDLTGLEGCRDLRQLAITGGDLPDLEFARRFPGMIDLRVRAAGIRSLDALHGLTNIELIDLSGNQLSDVSALATMPNLYYVDLSTNLIGDVGPLEGLAKMKELRLRSNRLSNLSPLSKMTKLWYLDLGSNRIANLLPLVGLPRLNVLLLDQNEISDVSPFAAMPGVEELSLAWNRVADVAPLARLEWLGDYTMYAPGERVAITLDLTGNAIDDPVPLLSIVGLGPGDSIALSWNPFGGVSAETLAAVLDELRARGVRVVTQ